MSLNYASGGDVPDVLQPPAATVTGPPTRGESLFREIRDRQNERDRVCKSMYTKAQQRTIRCAECKNHFRTKSDLCWFCYYYRLELASCSETCTACLWTGPAGLFDKGVCQSCRFITGGVQGKETSEEPSSEKKRVLCTICSAGSDCAGRGAYGECTGYKDAVLDYGKPGYWDA